jgi:hypothetical protein
VRGSTARGGGSLSRRGSGVAGASVGAGRRRPTRGHMGGDDRRVGAWGRWRASPLPTMEAGRPCLPAWVEAWRGRGAAVGVGERREKRKNE